MRVTVDMRDIQAVCYALFSFMMLLRYAATLSAMLRRDALRGDSGYDAAFVC